MLRPLPLSLHGRSIASVFDLRERNEPGATAALGYTLSRSARFTDSLLRRALSVSRRAAGQVDLEVREDGSGRTDVEITGQGFRVIIEAKLGWQVPAVAQLRRYVRRLSANGQSCGVVVALSNTTTAAARNNLPPHINGVSIKHLEWNDVASFAKSRRLQSRGVERHVLSEFISYLEQTVMLSSRPADYVYVASLGQGRAEEWNVGWIEVVEERKRYFHPVGRGYPHEPPTYVAFRYSGRLQSVHRVVASDVITRRADAFEGASKQPIAPHFVHRLGPSFMVEREIRSGPIRSRPLWCRLDELLTSKTVEEAARRSRKHLRVLAS